MLEFKPESRVTFLDRVKTALPFCESVQAVDLKAHAEDHEEPCPICERAMAWYRAHGIQLGA